MEKTLSTPVRYIKGIGPKRSEDLKGLGINSIEDLLYYFPRRYEDRTNLKPIAELTEDSLQTVKGRILTSHERRSFRRRNFSILEVVIGDDTGKLTCVWFNQSYLKDYFFIGSTLIASGKIERYSGRLQMSAPEFEVISEEGEADESLSTGRIVPTYSLPPHFSQRTLRRIMKHVVDEYVPYLGDFLPYDIRARNKLLNLAKSISTIHFPENFALQQEAYRRLSFDEFFIFQLPLAIRKLQKKEKLGIAHKAKGALLNGFIEQLPFELTASQKSVVNEILADMADIHPMQRLLQGDVGSGKTAVATIASIAAIQGGWQVAFMVPTEILARQHYEKLTLQVSGVRCQDKSVTIGLLTSSATKKEKQDLCRQITDGKIDLIIGTHALLEGGVQFKNLGLVVIDEQHKFGVGQRALLPAKGPNPDCLIMTATPIPRTLAITLYGDLDISVINELPPGRLPVKTLHFGAEKRSDAYEIAKAELRLGHQVYIVYPVIEESYALDIEGAKKMYAKLKAGEFREFKLGLIHGRLKQKEQDDLMRRFQDRHLDVLISTTVLEVGIDIANATCMVIENAGRFGLAQLHQLRGRVGRGSAGSFCILVADAQTDEAKQRLEAMVKYTDGFRIAEVDLRIRGPGEFFGSRQHGLSELKIGNPLTQMQLLKRAREEALGLIRLDRHLKERQHSVLREKLLQRFPEYERLMMVG